MNPDVQKISGVPTNIITGFLGVGKTSAILNLLKKKPEDERWAVLVNEFGEIGVDGSLFQGQHKKGQGVYISEVPGGCMCCAAGLPMQTALNQLLSRAKPDRLLIEPTGLGHPIEVMQTLSSKYYRDVLSLQKILTLVDARKLRDRRYTEHETFNQQIAIADIVVGNKQDLYADGDASALEAYAKEQCFPGVQLIFTEQGVIKPGDLEGGTSSTVQAHHHHHHEENLKPALYDMPIPECGFLKAVNQGEGFYSIGWRFTQELIFDRHKLSSFFSKLSVERMKAAVITDCGAISYNLTADALTESELDVCTESRIEIIAADIDDNWETELMKCIIDDDA